MLSFLLLAALASACSEDKACRHYEDGEQGKPEVVVGIYSDIHCQTLWKTIALGVRDPGPRCPDDMACYDGLTNNIWKDAPADVYLKAIEGFDDHSRVAVSKTDVTEGICQREGVPSLGGILDNTQACLGVASVNPSYSLYYYPCGMPDNSPSDKLANALIPGDVPAADVANETSSSTSTVTLDSIPRPLDDPNSPITVTDASLQVAKQLNRTITARELFSREFDHGCNRADWDEEKDWDKNAHMPTLQMTDIVDCRGAHEPCTISLTESVTRTQQWEWSIGLSVTADLAGGLMKGVAEGKFGSTTTVAISVSNTKSVTIDPGQQAYLGYTAKALRLGGWFRECDDGPDRRGYVLLPIQDQGAWAAVPVSDS